MTILFYGTFLVLTTLIFLLRNSLKFFGMWGVSVVGAVFASVMYFTHNDPFHGWFSLITPVIFFAFVFAAGRSFNKFIINAASLGLSILPLPWNIVGVFLSVIVTLIFVAIFSKSMRYEILNVYLSGTVSQYVRAIKDGEKDPSSKSISYWVIYFLTVTPILITLIPALILG